MLKPRFFYTLALWLLLPYILLRLLWRARKQPEYLRHVGERFGFYALTPTLMEPLAIRLSPQADKSLVISQGERESVFKPLIWLHTVSVGETRAAQSLVTQLRAAYPDHQLLLTHTTPTGRATSEQLYGDEVLRVYLPYDYPFAVRRFLEYFRPRLGILMETEIWFNLIQACHESGTPLLLLNARLSERSARGYARFARLTREALGNLSAVAAQTGDDAARLAALGARNVAVTGNLKFDIEPPPALLELGGRLRERFGAARKVFIAASTRDGEEALLLDALLGSSLSLPPIHQITGRGESLSGVANLLVVIVPRHPQRFAEVAALLEQRGIPFRRRSEMGDDSMLPPEIRVVLGDSMGEMFAYYAAADLAFIGGSLLPYGGQNLIEACAVGTPVLTGPHTYNFADATRLAVEAGAAIQVRDGNELVPALHRLLDSPETLRDMRRHCTDFVGANRGATGKSLRIIASIAESRTIP